MNYRDKILDYYKILLAIGWLKVEEDGYVSLVLGDDVRPATINGKRLYLPTREQMKIKDHESRIGFHPLRENYNLGISDVLASLRDQYVMRLNASIAYLMQELIAIAHDQKNQKNLTTEQSRVLDALKLVSANTVKDFASLQKKTRANNNADQFINIYVRKGGMVAGKTYGRAAIITFPIYQQLVEGNKKINGVEISGKDRDMLIALHKFIFPTIDDKESFNVGVNTKSAPFIEALIRATFNVVDQLVECAKPYMEMIPVPYLLEFPKDMGVWLEIFDDKDLVEKLALSIPNLSRGEEAIEEVAKADPPWKDERDAPKSESRSETPAEPAKPRGRLTLGSPPPASTGESLGKVQPAQERRDSVPEHRAINSGRGVARDSDLSREEERRRREEEDRIRRQKEREEQEERERRRREREEEDRRYRERQRERDREYDDRRRDRDDYDDRDRERSRGRDDRDDRDRGRTGDPFEDNPVLRRALEDEEDRGRGRGRGRGRDYERDRPRTAREERDRYYRDDRDRDRYDDRYDRDDRYYRRGRR